MDRHTFSPYVAVTVLAAVASLCTDSRLLGQEPSITISAIGDKETGEYQLTWKGVEQLRGRPILFDKLIDQNDGDAGDVVQTTVDFNPISMEWRKRLVESEKKTSKVAPSLLKQWKGREMAQEWSLNRESVASMVQYDQPLVITPAVVSLAASSIDVDFERSLLITDTKVVDDPKRTSDPQRLGKPEGCWTFTHLWNSLPGWTKDYPSSKGLTDWLATWRSDQDVIVAKASSDGPARTLKALKRPQVTDRLTAGWPQPQAADGKLITSPFRLLAIVLRPDLVELRNQGWGGGGGLQMVYGTDTATLGTGDDAFAVIFEYSMETPAGRGDAAGRRKSLEQSQEWFAEWQSLSHLEMGSEEYLAKLEGLVEKATNPQDKQSIHGRLKRLRITDGFDTWQMREFRLKDEGGLALGPLENTPPLSYNNVDANKILPYLRQVGADLGRADWFMDEKYQSVTSDLADLEYWDPSYPRMESLTRQERRDFSLHTCNGCHRETMKIDNGLNDFFHIKPRKFREESKLSEFFTAVEFPDPGEPGYMVKRNEKERRLTFFKKLLAIRGAPALFVLFEPTPFAVH